MALLDSLLTNGGATDPSMADSGTALNLLRQKFPGMFGDAGTPTPPGPAIFNSVPPTPKAVTPADPNAIPAPDIGQTAPENKYNLPWLPGYKPPNPQRPPIETPTGQWVPGTNKAQKLEVLLRNGLQGAIAGYGASANAVVQSGGRRSGGFGLGAAAGYEAPAAQTMQQQTVQRGGLENQLLNTQVQYAPQIQALGAMEKFSTINKNNSDAILNQAKTDAERYKPVGDVIYDMKAQGGPAPIQGGAAGQFVPATAAMATLAGIAPGTMIRTDTANKLETLSNSAAPSNVGQLNQGLQQRYQILNPGQQLPPYFSLQQGATKADFDRVDKLMQQTEQAQGTKALRDQSAAIRNQTLQIAQQGQKDREQKQGLQWVMWQDANGKTVAGPLSLATQSGAQNPAALDTRDVQGVMDSRQAVNLINKTGSKPENMGVNQLIDSLDKDGKLGVASSRLNAFLAGTVGTLPNDDPRIMSLLNKTQLLMTLSMKAHFGASGGRSPQMLEHFLSMANAKKMDAPALRAGVGSVGDYMTDRAMIPGGSGGNGGGGQGQISVTDPTGGVHMFPDQASANAFKKLANIP